MKELDQRIKEALAAEDAELAEAFGAEPTLYEMVMDTLRGRHRWLTLLGVVWGIVFMVLGVLAAIRFFNADTTREILVWALALGLCMSAVAMMKIWYWMELQKNAVTREIKRLELQIARLSARIGDRQNR